MGKEITGSTPTTLSRHVTRADFGLGALLAMGLAAAHLLPRAPAAQAPVVITDARTCAALAVYQGATADDWGQRAALANAALSSFQGDPDAAVPGQAPDCGPGVAAALSSDFSPRRWQAALDAVDAVASGTYRVPDACARSTPLATPLALPASPPADAATASSDRAQCVPSGLELAP